MDLISPSPFSILKHAQAVDDDLDSAFSNEASQRAHFKRNDWTFDRRPSEYRGLSRGIPSGHAYDRDAAADK
jgi:hypothetical protein